MLDDQVLEPTFLGRYAGFVTRLVAFVVDRALVSVSAFVALQSIEYVLSAFEINRLLGFWDLTWEGRAILMVVITAVFSVAYDVGFWLLAGQTLGKRMMGLRVVRSDGGRLRFGNALVREMGYVISGILFLGYLWILFDNRRQGFHDKLARTIVVYSWPEGELKGTFVRDRVQRIRERRLTGS